jgi:hypothetical protein
MKEKLLLMACCLLVPAAVSPTQAYAQISPRQERFSREIRSALDEPFRGVTADGQVEPGLFAIQVTGVTTEPVRTAADAFLAGLTEEQRKRTQFAVDDPEWRKWDNRHFYVRQGMGFDEMTDGQRDLAFSLLRAGLSAKGLQKTRDIMRLNETLAELTNNFQEYGQWLYWITIMGKPSSTQPWGWQLDGHHVVINYFVLGDQVVMTPIFMGSEPVKAQTGKFKGTVVMQDEQNKGLKLIAALDEAQRSKAIIRSEKGPTDTLAEAFRDNLVLDYAGICAFEFTAEQRVFLTHLIEEYVGNMDKGHARVRMDEVRQHLDRTYFAWIGATTPDGVFYYRVHSPVILIEFDHQRPIALARSRIPTRNHIHAVIRTPNGNDYGKDLLRQHYERHSHGDHSHEHEH